MKIVLAIAVITASLFCAGAASAEQYLLNIANVRMDISYMNPSPASYIWVVDFGREFPHIESVTLNWEGSLDLMTPWTMYDQLGVSAALKNTAQETQATKLGRYEDYVTTQLESEHIFWGSVPYDRHDTISSPFDCLSDGMAVVVFDFWKQQYGGRYFSAGCVNYAELIVNTTPVPEPSTLIALLGGLAGLLHLRRRRA